MLLWRPIRVMLWLLVTLIVAAATLFVLVIIFPAPLERSRQQESASKNAVCNCVLLRRKELGQAPGNRIGYSR